MNREERMGEKLFQIAELLREVESLIPIGNNLLLEKLVDTVNSLNLFCLEANEGLYHR